MTKRHYERWTDDEVDSVFFMRSNGKTSAEIAQIMGRSASAVNNVVFRERKRNIAEADSMIVQPPKLRQNITREELMRELLPGLRELFGEEREKHKDNLSEIMKPPTTFERIKRRLGIGK